MISWLWLIPAFVGGLLVGGFASVAVVSALLAGVTPAPEPPDA